MMQEKKGSTHLQHANPGTTRKQCAATGAGFNDCRQCVDRSERVIEKAIDDPAKRAQAAAANQAQRKPAKGLVGKLIHAGGKRGVLGLNCESDFLALTAAFRSFRMTSRCTSLRDPATFARKGTRR